MSLARRARWKKVLAFSLASLVALELAIRASGLVDFPTYVVDRDIGYVVRPSQTGAFLGHNRWAFNDRSMPIAQDWNPHLGGANVMLIGNSIVMGGNGYDQAQKIGPLVQQLTGPQCRIWPIATGGWTTVNESAFLERNPDLIDSADFFVWELMPGGFGGPTPWGGQYVFPSGRPLWATWYVVRRYVLPRLLPLPSSELPVQGSADPAQLERFERNLARLAQRSGRKGVVLLYPKLPDLHAARRGGEWMPERQRIAELSQRYGAKLVDLTTFPAWSEDLYKDGVHPTEKGNAVLARILATQLQPFCSDRSQARSGAHAVS